MNDLNLTSYNYELPPELIAQNPAVPRDSSRLLVVNSPTTHHHSIFRDLPNWLQSGDLIILNNTRVIRARLYGYKMTGAPVEILLLEEKSPHCWLALVKPGRRFKIGSEIIFKSQHSLNQDSDIILRAKVLDRDESTKGRLLEFDIPPDKSFWQLLDELGQIPLPPYIQNSESFPEQYQTIYAQQPGAVAAPTAGLHFTKELLDKLSDLGIEQAYITLHVGVGTFRPVESENITDHQMHQEWLEISQNTVDKILSTIAQGGRVIAVGTTVVRALEGVANYAELSAGKLIMPYIGKTDLFIYPGYQFRIIDGIITNFHLPCSSLLMLVSALIGRERLLALYQEAIQEKYRFYSFGDAMLILQ